MNNVSSHRTRRSRVRLFGLTGFALALGLLFWARLIVVSDLPRTAIADEEELQVSPVPSSPDAAAGNEDANPDFGPEGEKSLPQLAEDPE